MEFKAKVCKMGKRYMIHVPTNVMNDFVPGTEVKVLKDENIPENKSIPD